MLSAASPAHIDNALTSLGSASFPARNAQPRREVVSASAGGAVWHGGSEVFALPHLLSSLRPTGGCRAAAPTQTPKNRRTAQAAGANASAHGSEGACAGRLSAAVLLSAARPDTSSRRGFRARRPAPRHNAGCKRAARRTSRPAVARRNAPGCLPVAQGGVAVAAHQRGGPLHRPARSATARPESRARASTRRRQPPPRRCWPPRATAAQQRRRLAPPAALLRVRPCRSCWTRRLSARAGAAGTCAAGGDGGSRRRAAQLARGSAGDAAAPPGRCRWCI